MADTKNYSVPADFITKFYSKKGIVLEEHSDMFAKWLEDDWDKLVVHPAQETYITIGMFALALTTVKSNEVRRIKLEKAYRNLEMARLCSIVPTYTSSDKIISRCTQSLEKLRISNQDVYPVIRLS